MEKEHLIFTKLAKVFCEASQKYQERPGRALLQSFVHVNSLR